MDIARCSLVELVRDPLIDLVMKTDAVDPREFELLLEGVARKRSQATRLTSPCRAGVLSTETARCSHC